MIDLSQDRYRAMDRLAVGAAEGVINPPEYLGLRIPDWESRRAKWLRVGLLAIGLARGRAFSAGACAFACERSPAGADAFAGAGFSVGGNAFACADIPAGADDFAGADIFAGAGFSAGPTVLACAGSSAGAAVFARVGSPARPGAFMCAGVAVPWLVISSSEELGPGARGQTAWRALR